MSLFANSRLGQRLPGESGVWMFVGGYVVLIGFLCCVFVNAVSKTPALLAGSLLLSRSTGVLDTIILLTSSLCVAQTTDSVRRANNERARVALACGIMCGIIFVGVRVCEYSTLAIAPMAAAEVFVSYYVIFTGMHLVDALMSISVLFYMWRCVTADEASTNLATIVESGGVFWHSVTMTWIMLFALFYLLR
jgi:nitric oxide reductase NorE protein